MGDFTDRMKWLMALIYWVISLIILRLSCGLFVRADDIKKIKCNSLYHSVTSADYNIQWRYF